VTPFLLIGLGGALGANARFLISRWAAGRFGTAFPYGTFIINASGSFLIGVVLVIVIDHLGSNPSIRLLAATGFLGGYTTFSTFAYETVALLRQGEIQQALFNALGSAALGVIAASAGMLLMSLLGGRLE
jgi:CrcB protein